MKEYFPNGNHRSFLMASAGILLFTASTSFNVYAQELPIKPTRIFSYQTTEGSYMDVDLSPDGRQIVFDLLGDIYVLPAEGGEAVQLTHGMAYNRYPVWSPDGKQIAYLSDVSGANHVNVMSGDGTAHETLSPTDKQIRNLGLADGDRIAWTQTDNFIAATDGRAYYLSGGSVPLPPGIDNYFQFTRDGSYIFYLEGQNFQRYDRRTSDVVKVANLNDEGINPQVSPDGHLLTYITRPNPVSDFRIRDLLTGGERVLIHGIEKGLRPMGEHYCFTGDGQHVLIGYGGKIHRIDVRSGSDQVIPFKANVKVDMGPFDYNTYRLTHDSLQLRYTRSANASPDGRRLVFTALDKIYTMDLPAGRPQVLVHQHMGQFQPIWSPDGNWIAYVSWSDMEGGHLWRVPAAGGQPQSLTHDPARYMYPAWSPDGKWLAVLKGDTSAGFYFELQLIDCTTGTVRKVADSLPINNQLTFSGDGQRISFVPGDKIKSNNRTFPQLVSVDLNGNNSQIEAVVDGLMYPEQLTPSPDGRYFVYQRLESLYLVPRPGWGGPADLSDNPGRHLPIIRIAIGGMDPHWEERGKILSWSYGNRFYQVNPDKILERPNDTLTITPDQTITMQVIAARKYAHGTIVLRNARIITMQGDKVIEHGAAVITDGRFAAVGEMSEVSIPSNAKILDLKGATIMPGLIDLHDHVHSIPGIHPQQFWSYLVNLAYGVTTARDPSSDFDSFGYGEMLETGQMVGPRLLTVGRCVLGSDYNLKSLPDAMAVAHQRAMMGATTVKQYLGATRIQKEWLLIACRSEGLNMTNEGEPVWEDLAMVKDGCTGVEHAPAWGNVYNDVISFMAASGTWHTPTLNIIRGWEGQDPGFFPFIRQFQQHPDNKLSRFWPDLEYSHLLQPLSEPRDSIPDFAGVSDVEAAIFRQGGHIGMGSHGNFKGIGSHWELWALHSGGLTNMQVLKAATIDGAAAVGLQQDLGSIETGKIADLLVLDRNPLEDIRNTISIRYVMKDGELFDASTLNEKWPEEGKLPAWKSVFNKYYYEY